MKHHLAYLSALVLATPLVAQNLRQVRVEDPNAPQAAQRLLSEGYDVQEASIQPTSFELVVGDEEYMQLLSLGFHPTTLQVGRPLYDILGETPTETGKGDAVPANYMDLGQIIAYMQSVAASYPSICEFVDLTVRYGVPATSEGRHMYAVKISDNVAQDEDEPACLIVADHHAREITTPVLALDTVNRLTSGYGSDPAITALVDGNEIWIAPTWNPDGYNYVFTTNNLWRKNRHVFSNGVGVDQNRNYPQGWSASCSGSTNVNSETYKGTGPASESETKTMIAWSNAERFDKVMDFHSYGREVLYYYLCLNNPLVNYLSAEAGLVGAPASYGKRLPSAEGEHEEWQFASRGAYAFLTEIDTQFQPNYGQALNEATRVWPLTQFFLERPIPLTGHVTSATSGLPISADIKLSGITFTNGEKNQSGGSYGAYHVFAPAGSYTVSFTAIGYLPTNINVTLNGSTSLVRDVQMQPDPSCTPAVATFRNGSNVNPPCFSVTGLPGIGTTWKAQIDTTGFPAATLTVIQGRKLPASGPILPYGELLIDINSPLIFQSVEPPVNGIGHHNLPIPAMLELSGYTFSCQAGIQSSGQFNTLCNAYDVTIGCGQ